MKPLEAAAPKGGAPATNINLPNLLTVGRILLIPVFVLLFAVPTPTRAIAAAVVFVIAAVTDLLDGYLARRRGEVTNLGRLLDPVADKLLVLSGLVMLVDMQRLEAWIAILIIAREVAVTGMRAVAGAKGVVLPVETVGKFKMTAQVAAIALLILEEALAPVIGNLHQLGTLLMYVALALALYSGGRYIARFWREIAIRGL